MEYLQYVLDESLRVWVKPSYKGIEYSDGMAVESRLLAVLRQCNDVSCASDELRGHINDWPSEYHLSPLRANLLRPLTIGKDLRVLEFGCGFGAITRYLGETGAAVSAVEGSCRRAEGAAERCRDLPNVRVYCDNLADFETSDRYDVITLIGVLEYAPLFIPGSDPVGACLEKARSLLAEGGTLVLAIENQLGLKYFTACKEDHTAQPFFGLHGLYGKDTPITFGRRALRHRLCAAGLGSVVFYYPFPDYKLPTILLSEAALTRTDLRVADLLARPTLGKRGGEYHTFHENLAWHAIAENSLVADLANSFLIIARHGDKTAIPPPDWLAVSYSTGRRSPFWTETRVLEEASELHVRKNILHGFPRGDDGKQPFHHRPLDSRYIQGRLWVTGLWKLLAAEAGLSELEEWLRPWLQFLRQHAVEAGNTATGLEFLLPGNFIDCTPFNLIQDEDGNLVYIDAEWEAIEPLPASWVVVRGLFYSLYASPIPASLGEVKASAFISTILQACDITLEKSAWVKLCALESVFQTYLHAPSHLHSFEALLHKPLKDLSPLLITPQVYDDLIRKLAAATENKKTQHASIGHPFSSVEHVMDVLDKGLLRTFHIANSLRKAIVAFIRHQHRLSLIWVALKIIRVRGLSGFRQSLQNFIQGSFTYEHWIKVHDALTDDDREFIRLHVASFARRPLISILMPAYNTPEVWLRRAIESVRAQLYPHWELCIADDASTEPHVKAVLEEYVRLDDRIRIVIRETNGHISAASNSALALAQGELIALLDHDDELAPHALYMVAVALNEKPYLDLIYSDEDKIDETGRRFDPYFKPDWNPDLFTAQNVISHLGVYRIAVVRAVGGFREGYEGSQDWDLALRISEAIPALHICHIPHVLYHWRAIEGSAAFSSDEKPYARKAGMAAVRGHIERMGRSATISLITKAYLRVRYNLPNPPPLVSIIVPTRNGLHLLSQCIDSLCSKTCYTPFEILIVDNQSDDPDTIEYLASLQEAGRARVLRYDQPFNYSAINNFAARSARGELLCLMNNDVEIISEDWLDEMVSHAVRPEIGAVGAMLYYPSNRIQHAGVVMGMGGVAGHLYQGTSRGIDGYKGRARLVQNLSAVTAACLVVRKAVYESVGGMDEANLPVKFNDVDFCLRVMERGFWNLWTPFAELYHHESASRGPEDTPEKQRRFQSEIAYMRSRWSHLLGNDPAYNPNLALNDYWPNLAAPRVKKPWRTKA